MEVGKQFVPSGDSGQVRKMIPAILRLVRGGIADTEGGCPESLFPLS
jgi:hypothetical protein